MGWSLCHDDEVGIAMKIRVLGSHGSVNPDYHTSSYLINDKICIDAGSLCSSLSNDEQFELEHVFITHPHLDHIKDLAFITENTFSPDRKKLNVYSIPSVIEDIKAHLFNDIIWPDFTKIPVDKDGNMILGYEPLSGEVNVEGVKIKPVKVNHPGNATGYLVDDGVSQVLFTGDTGPTDEVWKLTNKLDKLKAVFTEITFPDRMNWLAEVSGHMTTQLLMDDLKKLDDQEVPVYISHFKPLFLEELIDEFYAKSPKRLKLLHHLDEIDL